jgi:hypothetical protein
LGAPLPLRPPSKGGAVKWRGMTNSRKLRAGVRPYQEYQVEAASGIDEAASMEGIKNKGYLEGYQMFDTFRKGKLDLPRLEQITNVKAIRFAQKKSF